MGEWSLMPLEGEPEPDPLPRFLAEEMDREEARLAQALLSLLFHPTGRAAADSFP